MVYAIKLHSFVDVITNSSTVIYTNSDGCIEPLKAVINEFAKVFGLEVDADEMFNIIVLKDHDHYTNTLESLFYDNDEYVINEYNFPFSKDDDFYEIIRHTMDNISAGEQSPSWFTKLTTKITDDDRYQDSTIHISAKDPKYEDLANKFFKLIYSTDSDESSDY